MRTSFVVAKTILAAIACGCASSSNDDGYDAGTNTASYDGTWDVQVTIQTCNTFSHTSSVEVKSNTFTHYLFTYCIGPGGVRLGSTASCGTDRRQDVAISGYFSAGKVQGNLFLSGNDCNGAQGYQAFVDASGRSATAGTFWGPIRFTKR